MSQLQYSDKIAVIKGYRSVVTGVDEVKLETGSGRAKYCLGIDTHITSGDTNNKNVVDFQGSLFEFIMTEGQDILGRMIMLSSSDYIANDRQLVTVSGIQNIFNSILFSGSKFTGIQGIQGTQGLQGKENTVTGAKSGFTVTPSILQGIQGIQGTQGLQGYTIFPWNYNHSDSGRGWRNPASDNYSDDSKSEYQISRHHYLQYIPDVFLQAVTGLGISDKFTLEFQSNSCQLAGPDALDDNNIADYDTRTNYNSDSITASDAGMTLQSLNNFPSGYSFIYGTSLPVYVLNDIRTEGSNSITTSNIKNVYETSSSFEAGFLDSNNRGSLQSTYYIKNTDSAT